MRQPEPDLTSWDPSDAGGRRSGPTPVDWAVLLLRAARRRWLLATAVFLAASGAAVALYATKRPTYRVEAKILAQRQQAMPSAVRSAFEDQPTRSAWEMIHRRENLIAIVERTNLLRGDAAGAPGRVPGDALAALLHRGGDHAKEDPLGTLVNVLDKRLLVGVEEGTITIRIDWPDARQAYEIVGATLQNFLDMRHDQEVKAIEEVIGVLQQRAGMLHAELQEAEQAQRRAPVPARAAPRQAQPSTELLRLQSLLEAKQRAVQDAEEFRRRRLAEVQAQLDQARNTLSDAHPTVVGLRKDVEALSREAPQVEVLREEERRLRAEYSERLAREGYPGSVPVASVANEDRSRPDEDPRVREARVQFDQMMSRVNTAQVELDAARAAFKYRYNVIWPPEVPSEPVSPNPRKILGLGGLAAFVLALLAAAVPDLRAGRIVERWQIERQLELAILAESRE